MRTTAHQEHALSTALGMILHVLTQAQEHEYDIIGHPQLNFSFVVVFPFHPYTDGRPGGEARSDIPCKRSLLPAVSSLIPVAAA